MTTTTETPAIEQKRPPNTMPSWSRDLTEVYERLPRNMQNTLFECVKFSQMPPLAILTAMITINAGLLEKSAQSVVEKLEGKIENWGNLYSIIGASSGTGKGKAHRFLGDEVLKIKQEENDNWKKELVEYKEELFNLKTEKEETRKLLKTFDNCEQLDPHFADSLTPDKRQQEIKIRAKNFNDKEEVKQSLIKKSLRESILEIVVNSGKAPTTICNDVTPQALASLCCNRLQIAKARNDENIGNSLAQFLMTPEGKNFVTSLLPKNKESGSSSSIQNSILLSMWSHEEIDEARMGGNRSSEGHKVLGSLLVWVSDGAFDDLTENKELFKDGFLPRTGLQRYILDINEGEEPIENRNAKESWNAHCRNVYEMRNMKQTQNCYINYDDYMATIDIFRVECAKIANNWHPTLKPLIARWKEMATRVALNLHIMRYGQSATIHKISQSDLADAILITKVMCLHQYDIFEKINMITKDEKYQSIIEALSNKKFMIDGLNPSSALRLMSKHYKTRDDVEKALDIAVEKGWAICSIVGKTKKAKRYWLANNKNGMTQPT